MPGSSVVLAGVPALTHTGSVKLRTHALNFSAALSPKSSLKYIPLDQSTTLKGSGYHDKKLFLHRSVVQKKHDLVMSCRPPKLSKA